MPESRQLDEALFDRLLKRERAARKEAERLLDQKSIELYDTNVRLRALANELELRVEARTSELQTQNSLLSALLENLRLGVLFEYASADHDLIYNQTAVHLLGIDEAAYEGASRACDLFEQLRERCQTYASRAELELVVGLSTASYNHQLLLDEDTHLVVDRIPVIDETTHRGALWAIRDVTEQKRQERAMQEALQRAEAGDQAKSTFLANMSHEIRTPLNGICGMARLLVNSKLDHEHMEQVRSIQVSSDSLLRIINDILDFSKVEAGQLEIEVVEFNLAEVMDSAFTVLQSKASEHPIRFDIVYPDVRLPLLKGDPSRLSEVLLNLLSNSLKFTNEGSVGLKTRVVTMGADRVDLEITVADTGIGMSSEVQARVFQPFAQADSSINRRFGGTGLGLSICRDLIQLMGGSLSVESEPGDGSLFSVHLPFSLAASAVDPSIASLPYAPSFFLVTASDEFYASVRSMLAYLGVKLQRVEAASDIEALSERGLVADASVLMVDRSLTLGYTPGRDADLLHPLPEGFKRILISELIPPGTVKNASVLNYPFSRYKLLSLICSLFEQPIPSSIFHQYEAESFEGVDLSGLRVLLAEDNTINQKVARLTIERFGASVDVAANGREALELVARFEYDLILLDIRMPEMDGVEACQAIRSRGRTMPIYALTADAMKGDRERFMRAGMNGYLSKPLFEGELIGLLVGHLKGQNSVAPTDEQDAESGTSFADELFLSAMDEPLLNLDSFYELIGQDREIASSLLGQFVEYAKGYAREGRLALEADDIETARSRFHKLAGSAAAVLAMRVRCYYLSFERSLMSDPPDKDACMERLEVGEGALREVYEEIQKMEAQQSG